MMAVTSAPDPAGQSLPEPYHTGAARTAPYPVSRLAPAFAAPDLAAAVAQAETLLDVRTRAQLSTIAAQIQALQEAARAVLREAAAQRALNQVPCGCRRVPGAVYHLYRKADGTEFFSRLAPDEWRGRPPHAFVGSFRFESDHSWTPIATAAD